MRKKKITMKMSIKTKDLTFERLRDIVTLIVYPYLNYSSMSSKEYRITVYNSDLVYRYML